MPETLRQIVERAWRDFRRYTGDGLPNAPTGAPLPSGDPASGVHSPDKAALRDALGEYGDQVEGIRDQVTAIRDAFGGRFGVTVSEPGRPPSGIDLVRIVAPFRLRIPQDFGPPATEIPMERSYGAAREAATGLATFVVSRNGVPFGTIAFAAGEDEASFTAAAATEFDPGDVLSIAPPDPLDATLSGVSLTILAERLSG